MVAVFGFMERLIIYLLSSYLLTFPIDSARLKTSHFSVLWFRDGGYEGNLSDILSMRKIHKIFTFLSKNIIDKMWESVIIKKVRYV